jgi:hypothetical protein
MAAILVDALFYDAYTARDLLAPPSVAPISIVTLVAPLTRELKARIQAARNETLEYYCTHRLANTARSYTLKQKE